MDKFPSISHLPFSPQVHDDDTVLDGNSDSLCKFVKEKVVIHEKLDGGNCCIFEARVFARSHRQEACHPWFNTIKAMGTLILFF